MAAHALAADIRSVHPSQQRVSSWIVATGMSRIKAKPMRRRAKASRRSNSRNSANGATAASTKAIAVSSGPDPRANRPKALAARMKTHSADSIPQWASELPA
jgi:hypothetical protein